MAEAPEGLWEGIRSSDHIVAASALRVTEGSSQSDMQEGVAPLRVLVVDDDELVRAVVGEMLRAAGHQVEVAAGPQDALTLFSSERFDVVLTDESMPDMLGSELAVKIKASRPETSVVLLTGWGAGANGSGDLPEGVDMVLGKPVNERDLLHCVARVGNGG